MLPYWLLYSLFAIGAIGHRFQPQQPTRYSPMFVAAALFTMLFVGLRYQTGGDWGNYVGIFEYTPDNLGDALSSGEPAFMLLNWLGQEFGQRFWVVTLSSAAIFIWGLGRFARNEPNPWLTILIAVPYLVIVVGMGYVRQAVAIALLMVALAEFVEGRFLRVLFFCILATLFHRSAIILLPLIAVSVVQHRTVIWLVLAAIAAVLFDFLIAEILSRLSENYVETGMTSEGAGVRVAMNVIPAVIFLFFSHRFSRNEQERLLWRNFSLVALMTVVGLLVMSSSTVVDRLALYLIPLQLVVFGRAPYVFSRNGRPNSQLILAGILYAGAIQFTWFNFAVHSENWLPYRSVMLQPW